MKDLHETVGKHTTAIEFIREELKLHRKLLFVTIMSPFAAGTVLNPEQALEIAAGAATAALAFKLLV